MPVVQIVIHDNETTQGLLFRTLPESRGEKKVWAATGSNSAPPPVLRGT
jgi:hypothetical protein